MISTFRETLLVCFLGVSFAVLAVQCARECGKAPLYNANERIVNGLPAERSQFPFMANVMYWKTQDKPLHRCGGSLYNERTIITAAHCVDSRLVCTMPSLMVIRVGDWDTYKPEDGEQILGVTDIKFHPSWEPFGLRFDVALLRLETPAVFTDFVQPICLPEAPVFGGEGCTVCGWGDTMEDNTYEDHQEPRHLMVADLPIVDKDTCRLQDWMGDGGYVEDEMICAGYEGVQFGSCRGDSGGPLSRMVDGSYELTGIVSFGPKNCTDVKKPGVYIDMFTVKNWIIREAYVD